LLVSLVILFDPLITWSVATMIIDLGREVISLWLAFGIHARGVLVIVVDMKRQRALVVKNLEYIGQHWYSSHNCVPINCP